MNDKCNCFICSVLAQPEQAPELTRVTGDAQGSGLSVEEQALVAETRLNQAKAVSMLVSSLTQLEDRNLGHLSVASGIRRALEAMLPPEPIPEAPVAPQAEEPAKTCAPDPETEGVPAEISAIAKELAQALGCEVKVVRFPRN